MSSERSDSGVPLVTLGNSTLSATVAPSVGGRITSLRLLPEGLEVLWRNSAVPLVRCEPGTPYDPWFYGGIDELLPCDIPEVLAGVECPDHGELWTLALSSRNSVKGLTLEGTLPAYGLRYERRMEVAEDRPALVSHYRLSNPTDAPRPFLWKLHAALSIEAGDTIDCPASTARPADDGYTRCKSLDPFPWPWAGDQDKSVVPPQDGTTEFLYLYDLAEGRVSYVSRSRGYAFTYQFDTRVFPFVWLFQSFGGFDGHYTTVLEPCTTMPISVGEAQVTGHTPTLAPGEELVTTVTLVVDRLWG